MLARSESALYEGVVCGVKSRVELNKCPLPEHQNAVAITGTDAIWFCGFPIHTVALARWLQLFKALNRFQRFLVTTRKQAVETARESTAMLVTGLKPRCE